MDWWEWLEAVAPALAIAPQLVAGVREGPDAGREPPFAVMLPCGRRFWYLVVGGPGPIIVRLKAEAEMTVDGVLFAAGAEGPDVGPPAIEVIHPIWGSSTVILEADDFERGVRCFEYQPGIGREITLLAGQELEVWADASAGSGLGPRAIIAGSYHGGGERLW